MDKIFELLTVGAAMQGFFLALLLVMNKNGNVRANKILAGLTVIFSFSILHSTYVSQNFSDISGNVHKMSEPFLLLIGPFIYFYARELVNKDSMIRKRDIFHFIPFILFYLQYIIENSNLEILSTFIINNRGTIDIIWWIGTIFLIIVYIKKVIKITGIHEQKMEQEFSNIDEIGLEWIKNILVVFVFLLIIIFSGIMIIYVHNKGEHFGKLVSLLSAVVIYVMGYRGLMQPDIFYKSKSYNRENEEIEIKIKAEEKFDERITEEKQIGSENEKYKSSNLTEEEINEIESNVKIYMESEKPYLDPEFSMDLLSEGMSLNKQYLSQVINSRFGCNFFNFVNSYRVEEVKNKIANPENEAYTILALAFEAGFNSKATFNSIFKKFTGMTPSEFKKSIK